MSEWSRFHGIIRIPKEKHVSIRKALKAHCDEIIINLCEKTGESPGEYVYEIDFEVPYLGQEYGGREIKNLVDALGASSARLRSEQLFAFTASKNQPAKTGKQTKS